MLREPFVTFPQSIKINQNHCLQSHQHISVSRMGMYLQPQIAVCVALLRGIPSKRIYYFECFLAVFRLTVYYYYYSAN